MIDRTSYTALEIMDRINKLRAQGKSEEDIATEFGFEKNGKATIPSFREYLAQQSEQARLERGKKIVSLMDTGCSLEEAVNELGLTYAEGLTLSLWYRTKKGD